MIQIVRDNETSDSQREFIGYWSRVYFGWGDVATELEEAPVHYRVFASENDELVSHVAVTTLAAVIDGEPLKLGAIGGLFTVPDQMGRGFGNALMKKAETLAFDNLKLSPAILFCLPELLKFYERRGWRRVLAPVTLAQPSGEITTWTEEVLALTGTGTIWSPTSIHVPCQ